MAAILIERAKYRYIFAGSYSLDARADDLDDAEEMCWPCRPSMAEDKSVSLRQRRSHILAQKLEGTACVVH